MAEIFISYRRNDSRYQARLIYDALTKVLPRDRVFMDIDSIKPGDDFVEILEGWVQRCDILLALIGAGWINATDPKTGKRRLDNPNDFVRIEVREALRRGIPVVPVLLDGAGIPEADELPDDLKKLSRRHAQFVDFRTFDADVATLIKRLELGVTPKPLAPSKEDRWRAEGRIKIPGVISLGAPEGWFLPGAGKTEWFKDFEGGPEMAVVPAGSFMMGSPENEPERYSDENSQHRVTIPKPFAIGRFAVTFDEWDAALAAGGVSHNPADSGWGRARRPAINVSWNDARAYIAWLNGKVAGQPYRLLSEAEWEYACRAGTDTPFWWGSSITPEQANYNGDYVYGGGSKGAYREKTMPVESFEPNPWGLYQVHGNVWEWCEDCWNDSYNRKPDSLKQTGGALTTGDCKGRVLRGGSWSGVPGGLRAAIRYRGNARLRYYNIGFRVARTF